ncbi:hypothetical protein ACLI4Y_14895 [Natrialbaceae archaeon A-CW3]
MLGAVGLIAAAGAAGYTSLLTDDPDRHADPDDLDIDPADGWDDLHEGVALPSERGEAVLVLDGEQFDLEGYCGGGETMRDYPYVPWEGELLPAEFFEYGGHFWGWDDDTPLEVMYHRALGWTDSRGTFRESDFLAILVDEVTAGIVMYGLFADGDTMTRDDHVDEEDPSSEDAMTGSDWFELFWSDENRAGEPRNGELEWRYSDSSFINIDGEVDGEFGVTTILTEVSVPTEAGEGSSFEMGAWASREDGAAWGVR